MDYYPTLTWLVQDSLSFVMVLILNGHYDFNWNDRLRLHRKLTSLLFLTPDWKDEWGGHHEIWTGNPEKDSNPKKHTHIPRFNRFLIDENVVRGPYHSVRKVDCPSDVEGRWP